MAASDLCYRCFGLPCCKTPLASSEKNLPWPYHPNIFGSRSRTRKAEKRPRAFYSIQTLGAFMCFLILGSIRETPYIKGTLPNPTYGSLKLKGTLLRGSISSRVPLNPSAHIRSAMKQAGGAQCSPIPKNPIIHQVCPESLNRTHIDPKNPNPCISLSPKPEKREEPSDKKSRVFGM